MLRVGLQKICNILIKCILIALYDPLRNEENEDAFEYIYVFTHNWETHVLPAMEVSVESAPMT